MNEVCNLQCKLGYLPWDENGFDEVVDDIYWRLGSRMKDYCYIVLLKDSILRIKKKMEDIYRFSMNEVFSVWYKIRVFTMR